MSDGRMRTITYKSDISGQVIRRDEADGNTSNGDPHEVWYRFGGKELGYTGNNGTLDTSYHESIWNRMAPAPASNRQSRFATRRLDRGHRPKSNIPLSVCNTAPAPQIDDLY
jgi:hypothetical protein